MPPLSKEAIERLKKLAALPDDEIDYSDIPPLTDEELKSMILVPAVTKSGSRDWEARVEEAMAKKNKKAVSIRLDPEVYDWFKNQGSGFQSRINAVIKAYVETQQK